MDLDTFPHDFFAVESCNQEFLAVLFDYLAVGANPVVAAAALQMLLDKLVMEMVVAAETADEGLAVGHQPRTARVLLHALDRVLLQGLVEGKSGIEVLPDAGQLGDRSEGSAFELVEVVVELIGVLDEGVSVLRDCKLDLADDLPVLDVDEDVVRPPLQPVDHPDQRERPSFRAALQDLLVQPQHFLLPRGALAAHQVHHLEADCAARVQ